MPIQVAANAGFCMGVNRAVETALRTASEAKQTGQCVYSLGELIHNPAAIGYLQQQGVSPVSTPEEAAGQVLIIRSHGAAPQVMAHSAQLAHKVVDCTCPFVRHVHKLVAKHSEDGAAVIILGDPDHPEIIGIMGWCKGEKHMLSTIEQVALLPQSAADALVVCQTTFPPSTWQQLSQAIKERLPGVILQNTICKATATRQAEAEELAQRVDVMLVVGGKKSANTRKLAETCRKWCKNTYLVECAAELTGLPIDPVKDMIGITAGASTPAWSLKEVVDYMNDMEQKGLHPNTEPTPENQLEETTEQLEQTAQEVVAQADEVVQQTAEAVEEATQETQEAVETLAEAVEEATPEASEEPEAEAEANQPADEEPAREPSFMDEVAASIARIRTGQTITGKIVQITDDEVCVNIGYKSDGLLKRDEMVDKEAQLGDEIEVEVVKVNDGEGNVILSQRNIVNRKVWDDLMAKYEAGEMVDGVGKEAVKGGLLANVEGVRAFIPASHLAQRYVEKISQFVGQEMKLKIIEVDQSKKRIVASRKEALALENEAVKEAVWGKLVEGEIITGIVRRFTNFGAFVDLGGVDGLIHVSDLSWNRSVSPGDILQTNQEVQVKVLSLDRERERIALGYKQLQPRPWDNVEEKYPIGEVLTRNVVRVRPFGAFVELEPGVDGLVHISQVSHTRIDKIEDALQPGQEVNVKVLGVDPVAKRISLSIKETMENTNPHYQDYAPDNQGYDYQPQDSYQQDSYVAPQQIQEDRPETALELAMRKAREELEAQENKAAAQVEPEVEEVLGQVDEPTPEVEHAEATETLPTEEAQEPEIKPENEEPTA